MKTIPICYTGNKKIFGGIFLSALSVMQHTDAPLEIILLSMDLRDLDSSFIPFSEEQRALFEKTLKKKNPESSVRIIDVTDLQKRYFENGKNNKNSYTPYASIRLFLDLLDVPDKVIYMDADVMCLSDIREYYEIDLGTAEFAATLDVVGKNWLGRTYCNSGIMLLNMPRIRETGLFEKSRGRVNSKWMMMPDQSALNKSSTEKMILPYRFNEQRDIKPDTVFKHFCKGFPLNCPFLPAYNYKQWHRGVIQDKLGIHAFDDVYTLYDEIIEKENNRELIGV